MPGNFHDIPKSVRAQWPTAHYANPSVKREWLPILSCTLLGFSTVLVGGRLFLRARKQAGVLGIDDLFITIGWIVSVGFSTIAVLDSEWYGLDVHVSEVRCVAHIGTSSLTNEAIDMGCTPVEIRRRRAHGLYRSDTVSMQHMRH